MTDMTKAKFLEVRACLCSGVFSLNETNLITKNHGFVAVKLSTVKETRWTRYNERGTAAHKNHFRTQLLDAMGVCRLHGHIEAWRDLYRILKTEVV